MNPLRPIQEKFYGDNHRWFFGTVINAHPPAGLEGRVKIRINGVHSGSTKDIPEKDLPWAQVLVPTTEGGVSGIGRIPQIQAGAFVFGVFMDGTSSQLPLVLGSLPRVEMSTSVQKDRTTGLENAFNYTTKRYQNVVTGDIVDDTVPEGDLDTRRLQSMKFFIDNGYSLIHASAITGALEGVSGFTTYREESGDGTTYTGIARWSKSRESGSRFSNLLEFSRAYQPSSDWKRYSIQLQFVLFELRNRFSGVNSDLLATTDIQSASVIINKQYLLYSNDTADLAERAYGEVLL